MPMKANLGENLLKKNSSKADLLNYTVINTVWESNVSLGSHLLAINWMPIINFTSFLFAQTSGFFCILDSNKYKSRVMFLDYITITSSTYASSPF